MVDEIFYIKNIDCATCAAKIEHGLKHMDGIEDAVLDFATQTLRVRTVDRNRVIEKIRTIDPAVELIAPDQNSEPAAVSATVAEAISRTEITLLGLSAILFVLFLVFEETIHQGPFADLKILIAAAAYLLVGWNVIRNALRTIARLTLFDENVLMVIATVGAIAIHAYSEAIGVMFFYRIGELLQKLAVNRSRRSIRALLAARPDKAMVITPVGEKEKPPESVAVGEIIRVRPGEKIPLDGKVLTGSSQVDTSPLTGEPVPLHRKPGDSVMAGQINKTGAMTISVTRPFRDSSISKIMHLVETATAKKARTEQFITTFARYYTPAVVLTAAAIALLPPLLLEGASQETWLYRALVILVISCPCALVVSIPLSYFAGIGKASRQGILIKGSNYIDALANLKTVIFDKTGTLTKGVFVISDIVTQNGFSKEKILEYAAAAEHQSTHPIATSIRSAFADTGNHLAVDRIKQHRNMDGKGVSATYDGHRIFVGNDTLLHQENVVHDQCVFDTTVANVVVDGVLAGYLLIGDQIRPDGHQAVTRLRELGIRLLAMLTGDNQCAAQAIARELDLDEVSADLLPEEKVAAFEAIRNRTAKGGTTGFVGDGLNDSPVIARADVGIAMGAMGSDAAIETADVVLMTDSPSKVAEAISIAQKTRVIVWQNIILALLIKGVFISFGAFGLASMWEAVFADMGTALLAILNASRILRG